MRLHPLGIFLTMLPDLAVEGMFEAQAIDLVFGFVKVVDELVVIAEPIKLVLIKLPLFYRAGPLLQSLQNLGRRCLVDERRRRAQFANVASPIAAHCAS